ACRKNRACAFLAGFRVVCCLFYRFPVRNALRASQVVLITGVMVNQVSFLWGAAVFLGVPLHSLHQLCMTIFSA
ncbi:hypothetical protein VKY05_26490, partial [Klebsiella pneumoniae]